MKISFAYQKPGISYSKIYDKLKENNLVSVKSEIVICVAAALPRDVSPATFNLLCKYIEKLWQDADTCINIQIFTDIVCDLYLDCNWGYRDENKHRILKRKDLTEFNNKDLIYDIYCERE